jgi:hypothetical protein
VSGDANIAWLDDETLRELDPAPSPRRAWKHKKAWIRRWVADVEDASPVETVSLATEHRADSEVVGKKLESLR